jgi:ADP-ribosylglycohydrolase
VEEAILKLGNGSFAPEAVSLGVFIALKYSDSFERAVLKSVNSYGDVGGDTDAIGFITGILVGGYRGVSSIPSRWLKKLEGYEHINAIVERLKLS